MGIQRISCQACDGNQFQRDNAGNMVCAFCGAVYETADDKIVCTNCSTANPQQARRCMECGMSLGKQCPSCGHKNPPGTPICEKCETHLDTFSSITSRIREQREGAGGARVDRLVESKASDLQFMSKERTRLEEEERQRLAYLAERKAAAQKEQRRIVTIVLAAIFVTILVGIAVVIVVRVMP